MPCRAFKSVEPTMSVKSRTAKRVSDAGMALVFYRERLTWERPECNARQELSEGYQARIVPATFSLMASSIFTNSGQPRV